MSFFIWCLIVPVVLSNGAPLNYTEEFVGLNNVKKTLPNDQKTVNEVSMDLNNTEGVESTKQADGQSFRNSTELYMDLSSRNGNTTIKQESVIQDTQTFREPGSDENDVKDDSFVERAEKLNRGKDADDAKDVVFNVEEKDNSSKEDKGIEDESTVMNIDQNEDIRDGTNDEVVTSSNGDDASNTSSNDIIEKIKNSLYGKEKVRQYDDSYPKEGAGESSFENDSHNKARDELAVTDSKVISKAKTHDSVKSDEDRTKTVKDYSNDDPDRTDDKIDENNNSKDLNRDENLVGTEDSDSNGSIARDTFAEVGEGDRAPVEEKRSGKDQRRSERKELKNNENEEEQIDDIFDEKVEDGIAVDPDDSSFRKDEGSRDGGETRTNRDEDIPTENVLPSNLFVVNETAPKDSKDSNAEEGNRYSIKPTIELPITQNRVEKNGEFNENYLSTTPNSIENRNRRKEESDKAYSSAFTSNMMANEYQARTESMEDRERITAVPNIDNMKTDSVPANRDANDQNERPAISCERSKLCVKRQSASNEYEQHPNDASYFYTCKNGLPLCLPCATPSLTFSEKCQMCMEKGGNEECPTTRPVVTKPSNENDYVCNKKFCHGKMNGHFANSDQIDQFYMCSNGITYCMNCPSSLTFDEKCVRCVGIGDVGKNCGDKEW